MKNKLFFQFPSMWFTIHITDVTETLFLPQLLLRFLVREFLTGTGNRKRSHTYETTKSSITFPLWQRIIVRISKQYSFRYDNNPWAIHNFRSYSIIFTDVFPPLRSANAHEKDAWQQNRSRDITSKPGWIDRHQCPLGKLWAKHVLFVC